MPRLIYKSLAIFKGYLPWRGEVFLLKILHVLASQRIATSSWVYERLSFRGSRRRRSTLLIGAQSMFITIKQVYSPRNWQRDVDNSAALLVYCTEDRLVCVDATLRVTTWTWSGLPNGKGQPFTLGARRSTRLPSRLLHMSKAGAKSPALLKKMASMPSSRSNTPDVSLAPASEIRSFSQMGSQWFSGLKASFSESTSPQEPVSFPGHVGYSVVSTVPSRDIGRVHSCFGLRTAFDGNPDSILSCGYWDHAIRRHSLDSSCQLVLGDLGTGGHEGAVNCLSIADGGSLLVTGSQDATCRVWVVANAPMALALGGGDSAQTAEWAPGGENMVCVHILYGHEAPVTCLAVSEVRGVVFTYGWFLAPKMRLNCHAFIANRVNPIKCCAGSFSRNLAALQARRQCNRDY